MKRIIFAIILLLITIIINFTGKYKVENFCKKSTAELKNCLNLINEGDYKSAGKVLKGMPEIESISLFIYKEESTLFETSIIEAESYLNEKDKTESVVRIKSCIYLLKRIYENQQPGIDNFI